MYWEQNVTGPRASTAWQGDGCGTLCKPAGRGGLLKSRRRVLPGRLAGIAVGLPPGAPAEAGLGMFRMCRSSPVFRNLRNDKRPGIPSRGRTESAGFSAVRWKKRCGRHRRFPCRPLLHGAPLPSIPHRRGAVPTGRRGGQYPGHRFIGRAAALDSLPRSMRREWAEGARTGRRGFPRRWNRPSRSYAHEPRLKRGRPCDPSLRR